MSSVVAASRYWVPGRSRGVEVGANHAGREETAEDPAEALKIPPSACPSPARSVGGYFASNPILDRVSLLGSRYIYSRYIYTKS